MIPLVTIEGPTASGKSELALKLALELGSQIVSADSRQVYKYLDIGTAKPSATDLALVRHHLISIIDPNQGYDVGRFCKDAGQAIKGIWAQGSVPVICGGTGLYVSALLQGIFPQIDIPAEVRSALKQRLAEEGLPALSAELQSNDPEFAARISFNDKQRVLRGLEVFLATGKPITEHWREQPSAQEYRAFRILIDPPREILYERINRRVRQMLDSGLLEEIKNLFSRGYDDSAPGLNSLGYKEFLPHLRDSASREECASLAAQHTRNYAKRQCTWYRKRKFDLTLTSNECIISDVAGFIKTWLKEI